MSTPCRHAFAVPRGAAAESHPGQPGAAAGPSHPRAAGAVGGLCPRHRGEGAGAGPKGADVRRRAGALPLRHGRESGDGRGDPLDHLDHLAAPAVGDLCPRHRGEGAGAGPRGGDVHRRAGAQPLRHGRESGDGPICRRGAGPHALFHLGHLILRSHGLRSHCLRGHGLLWSRLTAADGRRRLRDGHCGGRRRAG